MVTTIGFDTDAKGSIAVLQLRPGDCHLDIYPVPNRIKLLKNGTKRNEVNYPVLAATMGDLISSVAVDKIFLEDQWSRPSQDSGATFTFGKTFGDCRTATAAALLRVGLTPEQIDEKIHYVPGGEWKHEMRLDSDKNKSLLLADRIFPLCKQAWKLKSKYTSAAEAALLALWGAFQLGYKVPPGLVVSPFSNPILTSAQSLVNVNSKG